MGLVIYFVVVQFYIFIKESSNYQFKWCIYGNSSICLSFLSFLKVNYVKAIDKYLIVCFLFVLCSLLEYAVVLLLDRGKRKFEKEKNDSRNISEVCESFPFTLASSSHMHFRQKLFSPSTFFSHHKILQKGLLK